MARRFELAARVVGPDAAGGLDRLISLWREHLAAAPGSDAEDTAAVVTWPSRDIEGVTARLHGLAAALRAAEPFARPTTRSTAVTVIREDREGSCENRKLFGVRWQKA
jgi:hypothetical protein